MWKNFLCDQKTFKKIQTKIFFAENVFFKKKKINKLDSFFQGFLKKMGKEIETIFSRDLKKKN